MSQSKSIQVTVSSTIRPTFKDLPAVGTSGWYAIYAGFDPEVKILGLNRVSLSMKSTNKLIRYNCQRLMKRDAGAYPVIAGSGHLEPFSTRSTSWKWGPNQVAGLPITTIQPDEVPLRAVMIAQMQFEQTNVSTQGVDPVGSAAQDSEAMVINATVESLLVGDVNRRQDQGKIYIAPIPPPTADDGISGDFSPSMDIGMATADGIIEFPNGHFVLGAEPAFMAYMRPQGGIFPTKYLPIKEINKPGLWGEFFKLPHPVLMPFDDEATGLPIPALQVCVYGRIGRTTAEGKGIFDEIPKGTYVMVPQPLNVVDPAIAFSVQTVDRDTFAYNTLVDAILYTANTLFPYEGISPGTTSTDLVVDGVSLTKKKGETQGYKIHKYSDRMLKSSRTSLIPMPPVDAISFKGGMPIELCTPKGMSYETLIRNSPELRNFWKNLLKAIVEVGKVIVDVAVAVGTIVGDSEDEYMEQYEEALKLFSSPLCLPPKNQRAKCQL